MHADVQMCRYMYMYLDMNKISTCTQQNNRCMKMLAQQMCVPSVGSTTIHISIAAYKTRWYK